MVYPSPVSRPAPTTFVGLYSETCQNALSQSFPAIYNLGSVDPHEISELLQAFLENGPSTALTESQFQQLSTYLDLLLRWNSRINLTAIRQPKQVITRHFGESLFTARRLFSAAPGLSEHPIVVDVGSGAGFPGLPIKIWVPSIHLTLIESNQKKATFLREVIRALHMNSAEVFVGRAEDSRRQASIVTLRAVEHFERSLPMAAQIVTPNGRLALLVGTAQVPRARELVPNFTWQYPFPVPLSANRVLLIGTKQKESS